MTFTSGTVIAATFTTDTVTWILGGPSDDEIPPLGCGVVLPPRKPAPFMGNHAVPVLDRLKPCRPLPN